MLLNVFCMCVIVKILIGKKIFFKKPFPLFIRFLKFSDILAIVIPSLPDLNLC